MAAPSQATTSNNNMWNTCDSQQQGYTAQPSLINRACAWLMQVGASKRAREHARIAGRVALRAVRASSPRNSSVVHTPRRALHHPFPLLALLVPALGLSGFRLAFSGRRPARRHQGNPLTPVHSSVALHGERRRLVATETTRSGCSCSGGDPARADVRYEAQHDAKKRPHCLMDGHTAAHCFRSTQRVLRLLRLREALVV